MEPLSFSFSFSFSFSIYYLSLLSLSLFAFSSGQPDFRFSSCNNDNGNYTNTASTYNSNLNTLLSYITSQTGDTPFYNFTAGANSGVDQVNGMALCVGDQSPSGCKSCLADAAQKIRAVCPNQKEAIGWYNGCMLRYSNNSILSRLDSSVTRAAYNVENATDPENFNRQLGTLLQTLKSKAASGDSTKKYAAGGPAAVNDFESVYGLVECTPDLVAQDCDNCISSIISYIPDCCLSKKSALYVTPSCRVAYDLFQFYNSDPISLPSPSPFPLLLVPPANPATTGKGSNNRAQLVIIIVVISAVTCTLLAAFILWCCCFKRSRRENVGGSSSVQTNENDSKSIESLQFDLSTLRQATDNFSNANKLGQGGFGVVYKGTLSNGEEIAVKRLAKNSAQGQHEFKNEVLLVCKLKHKNLVRLLGFCLDKDERLLIYELLPNSSLDRFLFDPIKRQKLNWRMRYNIITGIAKGLLYLHEDSQSRIIHRDLKASNVLLDAEMNAKISDFGTAKLFQLDQTQGDTNRIVGTYGYMAPEYALYGFFSAKSDVYSFGVLLLEIITGRKNSLTQQDVNSDNLISWVWKKWRDGTPLSIIDRSISINNSSRNDILRYIHMGLLCVQEDPADRPTMSSIILMFSSHTFTLPVPSHPAYVTRSFNPLNPLSVKNSPLGTLPENSESKSSEKVARDDTDSDLFPR